MYSNHTKQEGGNHSILQQQKVETESIDGIGNKYCLDHSKTYAVTARKKKKKVVTRKKKKKKPKKKVKRTSTEMIKLHIPKTTARVLLAYRENLC